MKKLSAILLCLTLVAAMTAVSGCNTKKELNIMSWAYYVPDEVVQRFEQETGIKVNYTEFSTNEEMYSLFSTKANQYDIILCSDYIIDVMAKEGLLKNLDKAKIANYKNVDTSFQGKYYDPDNKFSIPYAGASAILCYDTAKVGFEITSYEDLWNEEFRDKLVVLDGDRDIIGITLLSMGYSVNETDPAILEQAKQKMLELKPNIIAFDADTPHNAIIRGDAVAGYMFGSQVTAAIAEVPTVTYAYPKEGLTFYIDSFVMSAKAPNEANAYTFLNFMLDGKNSAEASSLINYINCNTAAKAFLPQEFLDNKAVNIPSELVAKAQIYTYDADTMVTYDSIWTEFKAAK